MNCNDELYHYGVLGMKWGVHRARKKGSAYSYKSHKTKKYERQAEKYAGTKRGNSAARKAKSSARWDTNYQRRAEGASIARTLLLTGLNETAYQSLRASGVSKGKAIVGAILGTGIVNPIARNKYINDHSGPGGAKSGSQDSSVGDTAKAQKKWNRQYKRNFVKIYNAAAKRANNGEIDKFNKQYGHLAGGKRNSEYVEKYNQMFERIMKDESERMLGKYPR